MAKRDKNVESGLAAKIGAIVLALGGLLTLLALVSFDRNDLGLFTTDLNEPKGNLIGAVGAYWAGGLIWMFGLAAYLVPLVLVSALAALVYHFRRDYVFKSVWFALVMVGGASLLQLIKPAFKVFDGYLTVAGHPGGEIGYWLNDLLFAKYMGNAGSAIVMLTLYVTSFILLFEIQPLTLARRFSEWFTVWREARAQARLDAADPLERLELEEQRLRREARQLEKRLSRKGADGDEPPPARVARREPKIVDTTVPVKKEEPPPEPAKPLTVTPPPPAPARPAPKPKEKAAAPPSPSASVLYEHYELPRLSLLTANDSLGKTATDTAELEQQRALLVETLQQFGIEVTPGDITKGATITRYELYPAIGVRVERIAAMERNIARAMKAERVNILAPIPGKDTVGVEVPNTQKVKIVLSDLFESAVWRGTAGKLPIALGKDVYGSVLVADLAAMPHLLIAGTTGSGKSVCINSIILSLLYRFSPDDLRIILVDPKVVELQVYNDLPHLVVPVVTDPKKVLVALRWVINEMEKRYRLMARSGVRNITAYNQHASERKKQREQLDLAKTLAAADEQDAAAPWSEVDPNLELDPADDAPDELPGLAADADAEPMPDHLPYIVVIIDELADLMQTSPADVEMAIARLSAKARAAGIHLIIATQTPRAQVITGVIKTNVPCRIAFQVPSALDSRVILDENGAENLLGKGDLLYLPPGSAKLIRAQGAFVSDEEVAKVVNFISAQCQPSYETEIHTKLARGTDDETGELSDEDMELIRKSVEVFRQEKRGSTSLLQRRLRVGYGRASWVVDWLEQKGVVGPKDGAKDRELLTDFDQLDPESLFEP
ncbi:MAG: DNA translocase FtsK [Verrucomicrobiales bacterium]|jgi:S-DNA-T family DNA segregation ATPase FtsK/SpoIIIE|nr:DNA translocase FtsK [Verrucomicrobiales bacterium]